MKISDLFRQLSYGELSNLAISGSGAGTIVEAKWPQLIHYTNETLTALHSRFVLIEKELLLEQVAEETRYHLTSKYAVSTGAEVEHAYITDTEEDPFTDDLIRVLEVWGVSGLQYPLNDQQDDRSLFTPSPLLLQVPNPVDGQPLSVVYQANHARLLDVDESESEEDAEALLDQVIDVPHYLENALQQLIASKVFSHMSGQENTIKGQEYLAAYEADCSSVEQRDLANQTWHTSHTKLEQRGFI